MEKSFTKASCKHIKDIHKLSLHYNKLRRKIHMQVLLKLVKEHAKEIDQLYAKDDKHYIIETGDLLILCLEILKETRADPNVIMHKCYKRYYKKLKFLIENLQKKKENKNG